MACYKPLELYRGEGGRLQGARPSLTSSRAFSPAIQIACGQCRGCRLEHSRQWAVRCVDEAQMHEENSFITLTYSDENLPPGGSLCLNHWQTFTQRLRNELGAIDPATGKFRPGSFRYYHCGEYAPETQRPHYHALIFGHDFSADRRYFRKTKNNHTLYTSETLDRLWGHGHCQIGALTFESAGYVARYCMKKLNGDEAVKEYGSREHEYSTMSRRPGIGKTWHDKFKGDVFPSDQKIVNGKKTRPPRYYDSQLSEFELDLVKDKRKKAALKHRHNNTPERLAVRSEIHDRRMELLTRELT